jgi:hypothetical protein
MNTCIFDEMDPLDDYAITDPATYQYRDASIYMGEIANGKRNGRGRYYYQNGSIFEG